MNNPLVGHNDTLYAPFFRNGAERISRIIEELTVIRQHAGSDK